MQERNADERRARVGSDTPRDGRDAEFKSVPQWHESWRYTKR